MHINTFDVLLSFRNSKVLLIDYAHSYHNLLVYNSLFYTNDEVLNGIKLTFPFKNCVILWSN